MTTLKLTMPNSKLLLDQLGRFLSFPRYALFEVNEKEVDCAMTVVPGESIFKKSTLQIDKLFENFSPTPAFSPFYWGFYNIPKVISILEQFEKDEKIQVEFNLIEIEETEGINTLVQSYKFSNGKISISLPAADLYNFKIKSKAQIAAILNIANAKYSFELTQQQLKKIAKLSTFDKDEIIIFIEQVNLDQVKIYDKKTFEFLVDCSSPMNSSGIKMGLNKQTQLQYLDSENYKVHIFEGMSLFESKDSQTFVILGKTEDLS